MWEMEKKFIAIAVFIALLLVVLPNGVSAGDGDCVNTTGTSAYPSSNGTLQDAEGWRITGTVVCQSVSLNISGNITIASGATLILGNSNLTINVTSTALNFIEVFGTFNVDNNTNITANRTDYGFSFFYHGGSSGYINSSNISKLHNSSGSNGIYLGTSNIIKIFNSTINGTIGYALNISVGSPEINGTNITNSSGGIIITNGSSPTIHNMNISGIDIEAPLNVSSSSPTINDNYINASGANTDGIYLFRSNSTIRNNTIQGSPRNGIYGYNSSLIIENNTIDHNTDAGINITNTSASTIANNSFIFNNSYGLVFYYEA